LAIIGEAEHGREPGVAYGLQIDADVATAHELNMTLIGRLVRRDISRGGLRFSFRGSDAESVVREELAGASPCR
jgi:hypothetical protein